MSATLSVWAAAMLSQAGGNRAWGSLSKEIQAVLTDGTIFSDVTLTLGASGNRMLWRYDQQPLAWSVAIVVPTVACFLSVFYDKPTSTTDRTPLGTHKSWSTLGIAAAFPFFLTSSGGYCNSTPADFASDTADAPTVWTDPGTETGYAYRIGVKNAGATTGQVQLVLIG